MVKIIKIGSWLQNHPRYLEWGYQLTLKLFQRLKPVIARIGYGRVDRWLRGPEDWAKQAIFGCKMCGQCILHSTGMTCPMTCPKNLRNGPCGGVRANGHCEVIPEMPCVWVEAYNRSRQMSFFGQEILHIQPPVNRQLQDSSAWINMLTGADKDVPPGWAGTSYIPLSLKVKEWRSEEVSIT